MSTDTTGPAANAEVIARAFHETCERLAPDFGFQTRDGIPVPWANLPERNRRLLTAVSAEIAANFGPVVDVDLETVLTTLEWQDICLALETAGWRPAGGADGAYRRYYWPGPSVHARTIVPTNPAMGDYADLVAEVLYTLRHTAHQGAQAGTVLAGLAAAIEQKKTAEHRDPEGVTAEFAEGVHRFLDKNDELMRRLAAGPGDQSTKDGA